MQHTHEHNAPKTCEWLHQKGAPAPIGLWAGGKKKEKKTWRLHHIGAPASFFTSRRVASPYRCTHAHAATPIPSSGAQSANAIVSLKKKPSPSPPVFEANANGTPICMTAGLMGECFNTENRCLDCYIVSADRRATARTTTFVEPCSH